MDLLRRNAFRRLALVIWKSIGKRAGSRSVNYTVVRDGVTLTGACRATAKHGPTSRLSFNRTTVFFEALEDTATVVVTPWYAFDNVTAEMPLWSAAHPDTAALDAAPGRIRAKGNGRTYAVASVGPVKDSVSVEVRQAVADQTIITFSTSADPSIIAPPPSLPIGVTNEIYAHALDRLGHPIKRWSWSVVQVDSGGASGWSRATVVRALSKLGEPKPDRLFGRRQLRATKPIQSR